MPMAADVGRRSREVSGGEGGIRTHDGLPHTAFPVPRPRPLGDLSADGDADCSGGIGGGVAERVGFEPTVLSHTAFRERHHQPLGHLSAQRIAKGRSGRPVDGCPVRWVSDRRGGSRGGSVRASRSVRPQLGGLRLRGCPTRPCRPSRAIVRLGQLEGGAAGALDGVGQREDHAVGIAAGAAPRRTSAQGSTTQKTVMPASDGRPRRVAASRMATMTAWAVGSPVDADLVPTMGDHRLVHHRHGAVRALAGAAASAASARAARMYSS